MLPCKNPWRDIMDVTNKVLFGFLFTLMGGLWLLRLMDVVEDGTTQMEVGLFLVVSFLVATLVVSYTKEREHWR